MRNTKEIINDFIQGLIMLGGIAAVIAAVLNGQGGFLDAVRSLAHNPGTPAKNHPGKQGTNQGISDANPGGCEPVFISKLPCIEKETFLGIVDRHGADKILFATDSPWSNPGAA